ncbi:threonine-phosphate decarboxylase [Salipaludibacillus neizhouensis]|uniref:Aminotransferase n=1 Tax=Salipaludibacillus neizhouensis TaxID=885475 RepID=A0A3A9K5Q2_9BACI|nr:threonine-phosphate decarboxylase [Salipaludibacillus neizhouensis]RKL66200.1 threonine-phosphate decarboxylase [Salipaludibacillus neizhouensis]
MKWPSHGGQPEALRESLGFPMSSDVIDFSANINPLGPPTWMKKELGKHFTELIKYPDPTYFKARKSLAFSEDLQPDQVLVTNGGAEAIFLIAKLFEGKQAIVVHPTFLEYERACFHYHLKVKDAFFSLDEEFDLPIDKMIMECKTTDVMFLCRPNNPSGTIIKEETVRRLLIEGKKHNTYIVVDEAFVDFLPGEEASLSGLLSDYENLIILRSMTKMYAIPGLRVGYILADKKIIKQAGDGQIPWSVNTLAANFIPGMVEDKLFLEKTKTWLQTELTFLREELDKLNFYMSSTHVNFYLLRDREFPMETDLLFKHLLKAGIVARHTFNFKGLDGHFLRLAVRSSHENKVLLEALKNWRAKQ